LAHTQERKNKDIPEGGSKGTILLSLDHQDKAFTAFQKYVDSILDILLLPDSTDNGSGKIIDYYNKEEILFFGPDEGTANFMDWASQHAKNRSYKFWKAFTTGKSRSLGGIPHDLYGMTTRSIHQYVLGVLGKLNWKEENITKLQTGGPDGDLGSNEIKIAKDKTIAIVDGSGVLYDPAGLERQALIAVASRREMARKFDMSKLGPKGFFVDVDAMDLKLPDGTVVSSGLEFRNTFHLNPLAAADVFVPCGGRPESINVNNISLILNEETKKPRFQVIVEGANLFLTQEARLMLEKKGVVVFKDASANKGGVTSSSLEVLAALALTDDEFSKHMAVKGDNEAEVPAFYRDYVSEVHRIIEENARLEFNCIWNENQRTGTPSSILSDTLSNKINELSSAISTSELWTSNTELRNKVLQEACPRNLLQLLGLETLLQRVPETYARAIFSSFLASRYVYQADLSASPEFSFFHFISSYLKK
jgi:glutamate dehydrogenase